MPGNTVRCQQTRPSSLRRCSVAHTALTDLGSHRVRAALGVKGALFPLCSLGPRPSAKYPRSSPGAKWVRVYRERADQGLGSIPGRGAQRGLLRDLGEHLRKGMGPRLEAVRKQVSRWVFSVGREGWPEDKLSFVKKRQTFVQAETGAVGALRVGGVVSAQRVAH